MENSNAKRRSRVSGQLVLQYTEHSERFCKFLSCFQQCLVLKSIVADVPEKYSFVKTFLEDNDAII